MDRSLRRGERGTSTLEFAVVLPLLLLLILATVEFSRAWFTFNLITTASREGARWGAVEPPETFPTMAEQRINDFLGPKMGVDAEGNSTGNWTGGVTCDPSPCEPDSTVVATVTVTFETLVPFWVPMLQSLDLTQTASMRYE